MKDIHLSKTSDLSRSPGSRTLKSTPFISTAKFVLGIGFGVLGLVGKAIKGATGLLINQPREKRLSREVKSDKNPDVKASQSVDQLKL